jgi:hypothetical protein
MAVIEKHAKKKFGFRIRVIIKITQKQKKTLLWLCSNFKIGKIRKNRRAYDWTVRDQKEVQMIISKMSPYLVTKKEQAQKAKKILERITNINSKSDFLKVANLADSLARLNVRSKNRRKNYASMVKEDFSRND